MRLVEFGVGRFVAPPEIRRFEGVAVLRRSRVKLVLRGNVAELGKDRKSLRPISKAHVAFGESACEDGVFRVRRGVEVSGG